MLGCVQQALAPGIALCGGAYAGRERRRGAEPAGGQGCCGSILLHIGAADSRRSSKSPAETLAAFPHDDVDAIITTAAGCGSGIKDYALLFKGSSRTRDRAAGFARKVMDFSAYLA